MTTWPWSAAMCKAVLPASRSAPACLVVPDLPPLGRGLEKVHGHQANAAIHLLIANNSAHATGDDDGGLKKLNVYCALILEDLLPRLHDRLVPRERGAAWMHTTTLLAIEPKGLHADRVARLERSVKLTIAQSSAASPSISRHLSSSRSRTASPKSSASTACLSLSSNSSWARTDPPKPSEGSARHLSAAGAGRSAVRLRIVAVWPARPLRQMTPPLLRDLLRVHLVTRAPAATVVAAAAQPLAEPLLRCGCRASPASAAA
eukprot:CAMPEP_0180481402 /NCGR_PEP_ID=MMETSP1036_2-20121128/34344_1 /TAXON_ID=632150 /ORGANISM="Azadinium spinosum, Strain 3D9" /LENGTH=260 /DNA_ID=CAMNT_0022489089 /DNA_START=24 /DNA_END=804 /DNA_ORIENTATION=-